MVNDKSDTDMEDTTQNEETPFGIWKNARSDKDEQETQNGPSAVVTSQDGTQRLAEPGDLMMAKFNNPDQISAKNSDVKSFSATFGVSPSAVSAPLPPIDELFGTSPTAYIAPQPEFQDSTDDAAEPFIIPAPELASFSKEPEKIDPFAWSPADLPAIDAPRPQRDVSEEAAWMTSSTDYKAMQEASLAAGQAEEDNKAEEKRETASATINPYNFHKENQWVAPPMTEVDLFSKRAEEKIEPEAPMQAEPSVASPFELAAFDEPVETALVNEPAWLQPQGNEQPPQDAIFKQEETLPEDTMPPQAEEQPLAWDTPLSGNEAPQEPQELFIENIATIAAIEDNTNEQAVFAPPPAAEQTDEPLATGSQRQLDVDAIHHILQEHIVWLQSGGKNGRRANFRNANLQGCDLHHSQLAEASLRGADLSGANLSGANLHGADLSEAVMDNTDLSHASLVAAILTRADLRTAHLAGAEMHNADMSNALLTGANLSGLNLASAIFLDAQLQNANLSQANLQNTNLRGANLMGANVSAALLNSANCRDVCFDRAILDNAVFEGANMKNATMQGASLIGVDITVAEETSAEHRQESLYSEQGHIQQEWERVTAHEAMVNQLQAQIQQREMTLQNERANLERIKRDMHSQFEGVEILINKTYEVMDRHRIHDKKMKYLGVTWLMFTVLTLVGLMLFVKAIGVGELDWMSLSVVFAACALIMSLVIATTVRSIKLSNNLKHLLEVYKQQFPQENHTGL